MVLGLVKGRCDERQSYEGGGNSDRIEWRKQRGMDSANIGEIPYMDPYVFANTYVHIYFASLISFCDNGLWERTEMAKCCGEG